jgi:glucose-1-phosphatase
VKAIKNIIFDLGGVILPIDISRTTDAYRKLGISNIEQLFAHGHADSFFKKYEEGVIDDQQFIDKIKELVTTPVIDEVIIDAWNALLLDFPVERIDFLKDLQSKYKLFLFSNTNGIHHIAFHKNYRNISGGKNFDDLFEKAWYSHLIKMRKPDVTAFEFVINAGNIDAAETLFIDDALVNVEGAMKAGLQAAYLPPGKTIFDLQLH